MNNKRKTRNSLAPVVTDSQQCTVQFAYRLIQATSSPTARYLQFVHIDREGKILNSNLD